MKLLSLLLLGLLLYSCTTNATNQTQASAKQINYNRRQNYIISHPNLPEQIKQNILNGDASIGMTKEMVMAALGAPDDLRRSGDASGIREVWVYYAPLPEQDPGSLVGLSPADIALAYGIAGIAQSKRKATYLFFIDGIFTSFQEQ